MLTPHKRDKLVVIAGYGGKCQCPGGCDVIFPEVLTADHVSGGGRRDVKESRKSLYKRIIEEGFPDKYRILCLNCNWALGVYGYCPHQHPNGEPFNRVEVPKTLCEVGGGSGGRSRSEKKVAATRENLRKARLYRWNNKPIVLTEEIKGEVT